MLGSSRIVLPEADSVSVQPDLALFAASAHPHIASGRIAPTRMVAASPELIDAALVLAGKLAQAAKAPSNEISLTIGGFEKTQGNLLAIATPDKLPETLFEAWGAALGKSVRWPYRVLNDLRESYHSGDLRFSHTQTDDRLTGSITQDRGLGDLGALLAMKNPYDSGKSTLTLFVAQTPELADRRLGNLVDPALWGQMKGDLILWRTKDDPVISMRVSEPFEVGSKSAFKGWLLFFSNNPWYVAFALLIAAGILTLGAYRYVSKRQERKMAE